MSDANTPDHSQTISVLLIEDSQTDAILVKGHLESQSNPSFTLYHEATRAAGISRLAESGVDIVLLDLTLPDSEGLETFQGIHQAASHIPIVILSGLSDDKIALEAVRQGAQDFFSKTEVRTGSIGRLLQYAIERFHRERAERQIEAAAIVQRRLFPKDLPSVEGFDIAGRCDPANQVGGDYYDYLLVDGDSSVVTVVGDVSGHGLGQSLVMAETRAAIRTMATMTDDIGSIARKVNQLIFDEECHWFVTLFLCRLHLSSGKVEYVSAGHPSELLTKDGNFVSLVSKDPPLGIEMETDYRVHHAEINPGDTLLLYTDGISERSSEPNRQFGLPRLRDAMTASRSLDAEKVIDFLFTKSNAFANGSVQIDDMTAVVLKAL